MSPHTPPIGIPTGHRPPPRTELQPGAAEAFAPADDGELRASAIAVYEHRERQADLAAVVALSPFERALIEAAYAAGSTAATKRVTDAIGPASVTVSAEALIRWIESRHDGGLPRIEQTADGELVAWSSGGTIDVVGIVQRAAQRATVS